MSTSSILPVEGDPDTVLPPLPDSPPPAAFHNNTNEVHQGTTTNLAIQCVQVNKNQAITHMDDRLDETNWTIWRHQLTLMLQICGVQGYVAGTVQRPDPAQDPEGASNWDFNDTYAKVLIANNVTTTQMVHISQSRTAHDSWTNLEAVHDAKSHQTTISII